MSVKQLGKLLLLFLAVVIVAILLKLAKDFLLLPRLDDPWRESVNIGTSAIAWSIAILGGLAKVLGINLRDFLRPAREVTAVSPQGDQQVTISVPINRLRSIVTKALDKACLDMSTGINQGLRANVFLPKDDGQKLGIEFHSSSMDKASDLKIELEKGQGCTGVAWMRRKPIVADLTQPEVEGGALWGLTPHQMAMTRDLKAILSIPIRHPDNQTLLLGILSFDSRESIADRLASPEIADIAFDVAGEIGTLLVIDQLND